MIARENIVRTCTNRGNICLECDLPIQPVTFMHSSRFALLALLINLSSASYSQGLFLDEIVVTASKQEQSARDVASSIGSLTSEELNIISHVHINEALHRIPGVWISRGNGQEHLTAIRSPVLTGAGSCGAFLMMQDGISLRSPGFCNVNELFESTSELAERIEVLKGPGSDVYGSNALHGAINIITPAVDPGLNRIRLEAGPYDYLRTRYSVSSDSLRVDVSGTTDGGYKDNSGYDQQKLLIRHEHAKATTTLSYTNLNQETAGFISGDEVYKDSSQKKDNPNPEAYRDARSFRLISTIQSQLGAGDITWKPYLRTVEMTFLQHFLPGQAIEENGHDSIGLQALWTGAASTLRVGMDLEYTQAYLKETQPNITDGPPFLTATIPPGKHYDYDVDAQLIGLFARRDYSISDRLSITAGLRFQHTRYDYDNRMISGRTRDDGTPCGFGGCRFNRPTDREDSFSDWSPKVGVIYDLSASQQVYGTLSRGFRAPQATELYRLQNNQNVTDIDPVELGAAEIGFRGSSEKVDYTVNVFAMEKDNFIFRDTSRMNIDGGKTSHRGIEMDLVFQLNEALSTRLAFTYARHKYENNPALVNQPIKGNDIDTAPETLGTMALDWQPTEQLTVQLEWVHVGDYFEDPQNEHRYEGHDLFHLRANYQMSSITRMSARIMNLTDRDYAERADYSFGSDRYFVGTPTTLYLGLTIDL